MMQMVWNTWIASTMWHMWDIATPRWASSKLTARAPCICDLQEEIWYPSQCDVHLQGQIRARSSAAHWELI